MAIDVTKFLFVKLMDAQNYMGALKLLLDRREILKERSPYDDVDQKICSVMLVRDVAVESFVKSFVNLSRPLTSAECVALTALIALELADGVPEIYDLVLVKLKGFVVYETTVKLLKLNVELDKEVRWGQINTIINNIGLDDAILTSSFMQSWQKFETPATVEFVFMIGEKYAHST